LWENWDMEIWNSPNVVLPKENILVLCYTPDEPINHFIIGAYDNDAQSFIDNDDYGFWHFLPINFILIGVFVSKKPGFDQLFGVFLIFRALIVLHIILPLYLQITGYYNGLSLSFCL